MSDELLTRTADIDVKVRPTKYRQQVNILTIRQDSFIEKCLVKSGYLPEPTTTARGEVERVKTIEFFLIGQIARFMDIFQRLEDRSGHVRLPGHKLTSHD